MRSRNEPLADPAGARWRMPLATLAALSVAVFVAACSPGPESPAPPVHALATGWTDGVPLARGETVRYRADLARDELLHLRIEQHGLDVEIRFPGGEREAVDLDYGDRVPEELWWTAERPGPLEVELRSLGGKGDYRILVERRPASERDRRRAEAFRLTRAGAVRIDEVPRSAADRLERATELWRGTDAPVSEALAWSELGRARTDLGEREGALAAFDRALALVAGTFELALEGRIRHWRSQAHWQTWDLDGLVADNRAARDLLAQAGDVYGEALAVNDLAVAYDVRGELEAACEGFDRARRLFASLALAEAARAAAKTQLSLGRCYTKIGKLPEALATLLAALEAAEELPHDVADSGLQAEVQREIALWYYLEDRPEEALERLERAREIDPETPGLDDRFGTVYAELGEHETARRHYLRSLAAHRGDPVREAYVRANLCWLEGLDARIEAGLEQCRQSLTVLEDVGATGPAAHVSLLSAGLERRAGRPKAAESLARQALDLIESQRPLAGDSGRRIAFSAERQEVYRFAIDLRMELDELEPEAGWDERALEVAELTRERGLLDLLSAERVDPARRVDPELRLAEERLLLRLGRRARARAERSDPGSAARVSAPAVSTPPEAGAEKELAALEKELVEVRRRMEREAPSYSALSRAQPLDVSRIRELLDRDTVLLVYSLGQATSYLWRVDRAGLEGFRLADRETIESLAETWYGRLADPGGAWVADATTRRRARRLARHLLEPVIDDLLRKRRLAIVADGALRRLPFAALPSPVEGRDGRPLVADHEIVLLPSASVLAALRQEASGRAPATGIAAAVADPVFGVPDDRLETPPAAPPSGPPYRRLHGSADEAGDLLALASRGPTLLLEGFHARRDRVLRGDLGGFRIVHFATHADTTRTSDRPLGLVLSRLDEAGRPLEGRLGLQDLYALDLPAELVVLSACATALGEEVAGEGLVGLTRGFMYAGTPRVVVSLWPVRDRPTRELMRRFYEALLNQGLGPAAALRAAQASLWRDGVPLRHWAAFTLQGDWRPFPLAEGPTPERRANKITASVSSLPGPSELALPERPPPTLRFDVSTPGGWNGEEKP